MRKRKIHSRRTYRRRLIRNVIFSVLLLVLLWAAKGYPLPNSLAVERLERQSLLDHAQIVLEISSDAHMMVGVTDRHVHTYWLDRDHVTVWERKRTEPTLVSLPDRTRYFKKGGSYLAPALVAVDAPEGAASARITMELSYQGDINNVPVDWSETYAVEGEQKGGCWFFQLTHKYNQLEWEDMRNQAESYWLDFSTPFLYPHSGKLPPYTLEFFDAEGESLGTFTGTDQ